MKYLILITFLIILIAGTCKKESEKCHYSVFYNNNSNKTLFVLASSIYPDTVLGAGSPNPLYNPQLSKTLPNSIFKFSLSECIEWRPYGAKTDTTVYFIYDEEVLKSNDWEFVKVNSMYLQRYDLSLEDLRKLNFTIPYPVTSIMKDMKMWPKYVP